MSNTIQAGYGTASYSAAARARGTRQSETQSSFLDMAAQAAAGSTGAMAAAMRGASGTAGLPASLMLDLAVRSAGQLQTDGAEAAEAPSLEAMLKAKYPNLVYHVFDASSGYWKTRNDYPHYLLYQEGDQAKEALENWQPNGANPFYGSIDGRFIAPKEIHALGNVPPGSKAVVIHPAVQERMERDPAYAREIMAKIDAWFSFDAARNEAIRPGSTVGMSQAVAIGEDGNICNACASRGGGISCSASGSGAAASWWELRMARHAEFMKLLTEGRLEDQMQASSLAASSLAKSQLAAMLSGGNLLEVFGEEIAGVPTEDILALTKSQVWGSGGLL